MTYRIKFIAVFVVMTAGLCLFSAGFQIRYKTLFGRKYVYLRDVAKYYGMNIKILKKECILSSKYSTLEFTYDAREATINGTTVHLHFAPNLSGWDAFISEKDFLTIVDPILRYNCLTKHRVKVIMIDPGHGGRDTGALSKHTREKDLTLNMARSLKQQLNKLGYHVILTRSSDYFVTLGQRCRLSQKNNVDLFISIHCNSAGTPSAKGIETYCIPPYGTPITTENKPSTKVFKGNKHDNNNLKLAYEVQKQVITKTKATDRGVRHARFYVLKEAICPAILIETGFLSNKTDELNLGSSAYRQKIINGIAAGVKKYHQDIYKVKPKK